MIKIKIRLEFFPEDVVNAVDEAMMDRIMQCGAMVEREAKKSMTRGGGSPSKKRRKLPYEYYNRLRRGYVIASTPPDPPHVQTGSLRSSITHAMTKRKTVVVGPALAALKGKKYEYGKVHEFGGENHPERPFMRPAFFRCVPRFVSKFRRLGLSQTKTGKKLNRRKFRR